MATKLPVFLKPKSPTLKFNKVKKLTSNLKTKMDQFMGPKTTSMSAMEGRLKVANTKRKIVKSAVKKSAKAKTGLKLARPMV